MNARRAREMLHQVLVGERPPEDPQFQQLLAEDTAMRREYEELLQLTDSLDAAGLEERDELAAALGERLAGDQPIVARAVQSFARPRPRYLTPLVALAATALLLLALWLRSGTDDGSAPDRFLGSETMECLAPRGSAADFGEFRWQGPRTGARYELVLTGADFELRVNHLEATSWTPTAQQQAAFPGEIRWQVRWLAEDGSFRGSAEATARRR